MYIINSFKVFVSNISLSYKIWLYYFVVLILIVAIGCGIFLPTLAPVFDDLQELGVIDMSIETLQSVTAFEYHPTVLKSEIFDIISISSDVFANHADNLVRSYIGVAFLTLFAYFASLIFEAPTLISIMGYMESQTKFSVFSSWISNFTASIKYALAKFILFLPLDIVIIGLPLFIVLFAQGLFVYFAPMFALLTFILLYSFKKTFSCCFLPEYITNGGNVFGAFSRGLKHSLEQFGKVYANYVIADMLLIAICLALSVFTFGVFGIILPAIVVILTKSMSLVVYFHISGKRYYVDSETIVVPNKLKNREDNFIYDLME